MRWAKKFKYAGNIAIRSGRVPCTTSSFRPNGMLLDEHWMAAYYYYIMVYYKSDAPFRSYDGTCVPTISAENYLRCMLLFARAVAAFACASGVECNKRLRDKNDIANRLRSCTKTQNWQTDPSQARPHSGCPCPYPARSESATRWQSSLSLCLFLNAPHDVNITPTQRATNFWRTSSWLHSILFHTPTDRLLLRPTHPEQKCVCVSSVYNACTLASSPSKPGQKNAGSIVCQHNDMPIYVLHTCARHSRAKAHEHRQIRISHTRRATGLLEQRVACQNVAPNGEYV